MSQEGPSDFLQLGAKKLSSRLILGTGKYKSFELMKECHLAAETAMVTVALRRVPLKEEKFNNIIDFIDQDRITLLPNTAGAHSAPEALRLAQIASSLQLSFLKLEVMAETKTLLPDPIETLKATKLIKANADTQDLFLMVYTNDDPVLALKLVEAGADCIMPAGSPIGSGRGIQNQGNLELLKTLNQNKTPIILDAGIGCASDAVKALELGLDGVLLNSAVAGAKDPIMMARAMKHAVLAGRESFLAGRIEKKLFASASSPLPDF